MKTGKKIGYGLLALVPCIGNFILQTGVVVLVEIGVAVWLMLQDGGGGGVLSYTMQAGRFLMDHYMETLMLTQLVLLPIFGLWYYLAFVRRKEKTALKSIFGAKNLLAFFVIGVAGYLFINCYLVTLFWISPEAMQRYEELIKMSDIGSLTLVSTISTMVLAPLGEEIVFRGLTYRYFRKAGIGFIVANVLQAALFGIMHLNWVQGSYAFALGLLLGYMGRRYNSLLVPMFLHMVFNFAGTYIARALEFLPQNGIINLLLLALAAALAVLAFKLMGKSVQAPVTDACGTGALPTECTDTIASQSDRESESK